MVMADTDQFLVTCSDDQFTFTVKSKVKGIRSRTFKGEMAWSNAQRYISDKFKTYVYF